MKWEGDKHSPPHWAFGVLEFDGDMVLLGEDRDGEEFYGMTHQFRPFWL